MAGPHSMRTPLGRVKGLGPSGEGTGHFIFQRSTAIANIPLVLFFIGLMIVMQGKSFAEARKLVSHPLVAILFIMFFVSILSHMRTGVQTIIEDYVHGAYAKALSLLANTFYAIAIGIACLYAILKINFGA